MDKHQESKQSPQRGKGYSNDIKKEYTHNNRNCNAVPIGVEYFHDEGLF